MMSQHAVEVDDRGPNDLVPDAVAVAELGRLLGAVASAWTNAGSKSRWNWRASADGAGGVLQALDGLQAADLVEEPAARREHQHGVLLHLEQAKGIGRLAARRGRGGRAS